MMSAQKRRRFVLPALIILTGAAALFLNGPVPAGAADQDDEPKLVPGGFGGRKGKAKESLLAAEGGNEKSEAAVAAGLKWLARHQANDGSWGGSDFAKDGKCNCGNPGHNDRMFGTAIALLPFLGAGETHKGQGKNAIYAKNVDRALKWMIAKQGADGVFSGNGYIQGIVTLAVCEAYAMTEDVQLKGPAQRGITAIVDWQGANGGFRYGPKQNGDLSVTSWHLQALKAGQQAKLNVPNATLAGVNQFLDAMSTPDGAGYGYTEPKPSPSMTAAGLLCRENMGWGARHPGLAKGIDSLHKQPPAAAFKNMYYYYFATQAVRHRGGDDWKKWNDKMRDLLIASQDQGQNADKKDQKGSWDPAGDAFGAQFGRLGHTALCLLTLEVYYRHVPLISRDRP